MTAQTASKEGGGTRRPAVEPRSEDVWRDLKRRVQRGLDAPVRNRRDFVVRLEQLKRTYKQGDFSEPAKTACLNLYEYISRKQLRETAESWRQLRETPEFWKAGTLVYELADSFNVRVSQEIKEWASAEGKTLYKKHYEKWGVDREILARKSPEAKALMRDHVLFITCYGNEQKRKGDIGDALEVFETLYDFTSKVLASDGKMPCNATLAILSYHLGSIRRLREEYLEAEEMYHRALDFYYRRSMTRPDDLDDFFFVTRRVAMCVGLGLGWINLTRSYLRRAASALATSRVLLAHIPDPLVRSFVDMLYATIKRVRAGRDDHAEIERAIATLTRAHAVFEKHKHQRYRMHASYELALAYNLKGEYDAAERHLRYVERHAGNDKWRAKVHTLRSRIRRGEGKLDAALEEAGRAVSAADKSRLKLPLADAYITLGEVKFYLAAGGGGGQGATYADALRDFEKALAQARPTGGDGARNLNQKLVSVCALRIAQCHVREGAWKDAHANLRRWWELKPHVEHQWVHELAAQVEKEFQDMTEDFTVPANDHSKWDFTERAHELQRWLVAQAMRRTGDDTAQAALLLGYTEKRLKGLLRGQWRKKKKGKAGAVA